YLFDRHILRKYLPYLYRIFQEKPLFISPIGQPIPDAEEVLLSTTNNLRLHGCYLKASSPRKGVILFGLEYGSNCWSCQPYCEFLRENGYDIFAFETRGQGKSLPQEGYQPLQWVTASRKRKRSEEHTSELQSRENLVCRLLLEKKKDKK